MRPSVAHGFVCLLRGGIDRQRRVGLVGFRKGHLGVGAVDRTGRSHQKVFHANGLRDFHHVERASHIGVDIGARIVERVTDASLGRQMHDNIGLKIHDGLGQRRLILQHADGGRELLVLMQQIVTTFLECHVVVICQPVITGDRVTLLQENLGQVKSDEASRAGDENAGHGTLLRMMSGRAVSDSKLYKVSTG